MTKKEQINIWVTKNPPKPNQRGYYKNVAKRFDTESEYVRSIVKKMEVPNIVDNCQAKRTKRIMGVPVDQTEVAGKILSKKSFSYLIDVEFNSNVKFNIPQSIKYEINHTIVKPGKYKVGIINDVHFPYHSEKNLAIALEKLLEANVDKIVLNGDVVDFYSISKFSSIPDAPLLKQELEMAIDLIAQIRKHFPKAEIFYKVGNHENRLYRYLTDRAAGLWGLDELSLPNLLKLDEYNVRFIDDHEFLIIGDMHIMHGHELGVSTAGINVAATMHKRFHGSMCFGHFHKSQDWYRDLPNGNIQESHAIGGLCDLNPQYRPMNDWNAGFAIIEFEESGEWLFHNYRIHKNKIVNVWPH